MKCRRPFFKVELDGDQDYVTLTFTIFGDDFLKQRFMRYVNSPISALHKFLEKQRYRSWRICEPGFPPYHFVVRPERSLVIFSMRCPTVCAGFAYVAMSKTVSEYFYTCEKTRELLAAKDSELPF